MLCIILEVWQASISAGRKHVTVVSPNQDIRPKLSSCLNLYCSCPGMDLIPICNKRRFTSVEREAGLISFNLCCNLKAEVEVTLWAGMENVYTHQTTTRCFIYMRTCLTHVQYPQGHHSLPPQSVPGVSPCRYTCTRDICLFSLTST